MADEGEEIQELIRRMYESAENSPWELSPEEIRAQGHRGWLALPDPKILAAALVVVALVVAGLVLTTGSNTRKSADQTAVTSPSVSSIPSTIPPRGQQSTPTTMSTPGIGSPTTIGGTPSSPVTTSAPTPTTTSASPSPLDSTPSTTSTACSSGNVSVNMADNPGPVVLCAGSELDVTFAFSDPQPYGSWHGQPTFSVPSVLTEASQSTSGQSLIVLFATAGTGTTQIEAYFNQTCAPTDQTPCTIPPQIQQTLSVTVANS